MFVREELDGLCGVWYEVFFFVDRWLGGVVNDRRVVRRGLFSEELDIDLIGIVLLFINMIFDSGRE